MAGANQMGQMSQMGQMGQMGPMGSMGIPQAVMAAQAPGMITGVYRDMCEYRVLSTDLCTVLNLFRGLEDRFKLFQVCLLSTQCYCVERDYLVSQFL